MRRMSYALVTDVFASWEHYAEMARSLERVPPGLLLHFAGPTDEGIRIIEVWESEVAWRQFASEFERALASVEPGVGPRTVVRDLRAAHLLIGEALRGDAARDWIAVGPGVVEVLTQDRSSATLAPNPTSTVPVTQRMTRRGPGRTSASPIAPSNVE
jgi:hypothetical protein